MTATKHELACQPRKLFGRKLKKLRLTGVTPANVFGNKITSVNIQTNTKEFQKFYSLVGESTLSYLNLEGEKAPLPVFVKEVTKHPVTGDLLHIVFHQVNLKEKVTAQVPLLLVGEPLAEKEKLGIMVQQIDEIEVEALPTDMPEKIEIDVTSLSQAGSNILVKDLSLDKSKLTVKTDPESIVVQIEALAKEEVAPVAAEVPAETAEKVEGETKTEEADKPADVPSKPEPKK